MKRVLVIAAMSVLVPTALAQMKGMEMKDMPMKMGEGKAGETHKGKGTVTLVHDPIKSMNWPAMTMAFKAKDKAMLENVKPGAKVEFSFEQSGKHYIITQVK